MRTAVFDEVAAMLKGDAAFLASEGSLLILVHVKVTVQVVRFPTSEFFATFLTYEAAFFLLDSRSSILRGILSFFCFVLILRRAVRVTRLISLLLLSIAMRLCLSMYVFSLFDGVICAGVFWSIFLVGFLPCGVTTKPLNLRF